MDVATDYVYELNAKNAKQTEFNADSWVTKAVFMTIYTLRHVSFENIPVEQHYLVEIFENKEFIPDKASFKDI